MSGFKETDSGIAASVFLAIYSIYAPFMCYVVYKRGIRTVYGFIWFFTIIRFAGQLCGVVYAKIGPDYWQWLIAYLVLGAEGYFALILAAFHTTCKGQKHGLGRSWLEDSGPGRYIKFPILKKLCRSWASTFKTILIPANALVISAGITLAGISTGDVQDDSSQLHLSKVQRTIGQAMFLGMTVGTAILNVYVMLREVNNLFTIAVAFASPFLIVRGVFGIISIFLSSMNYFNPKNYQEGLNWEVVMFEYVLGTSMELFASLCLLSQFFLEKKYDNYVQESLEEDQKDFV